MKTLFLTLAISSALAGQTLACGGGFNDFVPCQAEQAGSYNPFLKQLDGAVGPPISPIDSGQQPSAYDLEQQRQQIQNLQQLQQDQQRDAWHDSCPYGSFGCSTYQ
ncbi:hypothetical protein [Rhizobium leguminosarum]|uniref:hypothetical protein n=1 Tax=Rhizobium leguminosarum TaxID=384 RepID=UPI000483C230|nr:hypothetical protein [Rhizobium leguminosarum]